MTRGQGSTLKGANYTPNLPTFVRYYVFDVSLGGRNSGGQDERKRATETEKRRTNAPLPLFIYTPKDSRLRFLAPKHTSRLLFLSEVPHSIERLGDRAEASWGQGTSVHPHSLYMTFHTLATSARRECVHKCVADHVCMCTVNLW